MKETEQLKKLMEAIDSPYNNAAEIEDLKDAEVNEYTTDVLDEMFEALNKFADNLLEWDEAEQLRGILQEYLEKLAQ